MSVKFDLNDTYKHKGLRRKLVKTIESKGIKEQNILDAIQKIPRHFFLDSAFDELAYADQAMQIGEGQTISQPFTVAYQTRLLDIQPGDKVLEIGLGSGYQASILAELGADVYSIERIGKLIPRAKEILELLHYQVNIFEGDGTLGLQEHAPFDKIIVTAAAKEIPNALKEQLSPGGILVIPVGDKSNQIMTCIRKVSAHNYITERYEQFRFVPLIGKNGW